MKKTNVLLFKNKNESNVDKIELKINNELLEEKVFAKYLGIIFDNKLITVKYYLTVLVPACTAYRY